MHTVKVIIPIYRTTLSPMEYASISQTIRVLGKHPIVVIHPNDVKPPQICKEHPLQLLPVSNQWLGTLNGIAGYNQMMMSYEFYKMFTDTKYILICHTDAWIFRDELLMWCKKGYDCIAAPWIKRSFYNWPFIKEYIDLLTWYKTRNQQPCRQLLYGKIGNGGLSLRRIEAFKQACITYKKIIEQYIMQHDHYHNEDVFWATVPKEFHYPTEEEALHFAFDRHPKTCLKRIGGQLPFGCHSWSKPRMYRFWKNIINWNYHHQ